MGNNISTSQIEKSTVSREERLKSHPIFGLSLYRRSSPKVSTGIVVVLRQLLMPLAWAFVKQTDRAGGALMTVPFGEKRLAFQVPSLRVIMLEKGGSVFNRGRRSEL